MCHETEGAQAGGHQHLVGWPNSRQGCQESTQGWGYGCTQVGQAPRQDYVTLTSQAERSSRSMSAASCSPLSPLKSPPSPGLSRSPSA